MKINMIFLILTLSVSFKSLHAKVISIEDAIYKSGTITTKFTHSFCSDQNLSLELYDCKSTYPLSCKASIKTSSKDVCPATPKVVTKTFPLPQEYKDTAFLLKLNHESGDDVEVVVSENIQQPAIISTIEFFPIINDEGQIKSFTYRADVIIGNNSCQAEGVEVSVKVSSQADFILLQANKEFARIKNQFLCLGDDIKPVVKTLTGSIPVNSQSNMDLVIKNVEKISNDQKINLMEDIDEPFGT